MKRLNGPLRVLFDDNFLKTLVVDGQANVEAFQKLLVAVAFKRDVPVANAIQIDSFNSTIAQQDYILDGTGGYPDMTDRKISLLTFGTAVMSELAGLSDYTFNSITNKLTFTFPINDVAQIKIVSEKI